MKILHITNWYPSRPTPANAKWIRNHIKALSNNADNIIYHLEIRKGSMKIKSGRNTDGSFFIIIYSPKTIWKIFEIISLLLLIGVIIKNRGKKFDIINFHIAYPNCVYVSTIKMMTKLPVVITEHWSGYHYNFNIPKANKRKRIQKIFLQDIPVIAVSRALLQDIRNFASANFPGFVIPNIVDITIFNYRKGRKIPDDSNFLMISQWKWPKDPFTVIEAWNKLKIQFPDVNLRIGGYGPQYEDMKEMIKKLDLLKQVTLLGQLTSEEVAEEMSRAKAFIHCSDYETFSVVCAESLCCGTPVIASKVGGIPEYVHSNNGILISENSPEAFYFSIMNFLNNNMNFDYEKISREARDKFSEKEIGNKYHDVLSEILSD